MSANSVTCSINSIEYYNKDTRRVLLDVPPGNDVSFSAGQYLQMVLPHKKCPFSIANSPHLKNQIELHIRPTPGSEDSTVIEALLDNAKEIEIEAPMGREWSTPRWTLLSNAVCRKQTCTRIFFPSPLAQKTSPEKAQVLDAAH